MIQTQAVVVEKERLAPAWWRLTLSAPDLSPPLQPGQFLLVRCDAPLTCYLRRPIFPQSLVPDRLTVLLRPDPDPGTAWLSARQADDRLDIIGPLGRGFHLPDSAQNILLVSDSHRLSPLLAIMEQAVAASLSVTLALGGRRAVDIYPVSRLPPLVEFQTATLDGSLGRQGSIDNLLPDLARWADVVFAVGSARLYQTIKAEAARVRFGSPAGFAYGLVKDYPLACGVGSCLSCALQTEAGLKLACLDGPVFDLALLDEAL